MPGLPARGKLAVLIGLLKAWLRHLKKMRAGKKMRIRIGLLAAGMMMAAVAPAEVCTTQSQMTAADRDALAGVARGLADKVQAGDVSGLQAATARDYAKDFSGIGPVVNATAAKVKGGTPLVQQVYLLDATQLKPGGGWCSAGGAVFLFAQQDGGGGGLHDLRANSRTLWFCDR